ncbi:hypothetical protein AYR47_15480 [Pseudomonas azotoformans]|uniref:Uncharacterized protein n=1 Tax=Pseudomonas azotoformans TaxID=47878 RepID=A0A127HYX4_PSEAZ|nr:hypothetical protein AYR47_15480 [Pseudomonas azotoformans]
MAIGYRSIYTYRANEQKASNTCLFRTGSERQRKVSIYASVFRERISRPITEYMCTPCQMHDTFNIFKSSLHTCPVRKIANEVLNAINRVRDRPHQCTYAMSKTD